MNPLVSKIHRKEKRWSAEFAALRQLSLASGLNEELKWGQACYDLDGRNVVLIHGFKDYCALLFMKGALLKGPKGILIQQTKNVQAARQIRFASLADINKQKAAVKVYLREAIAVVPSLLHARHAPNGQTLEQSLPHDLYIRWLALRVKYLGYADDEKMRPILAAANLYRRAIDQVGLTHNSHVWQRIEATARAKHVPVQPVSLEVPIDNPKQYVRDLSAIPSAGEIDCLRSTVGLSRGPETARVGRLERCGTGRLLSWDFQTLNGG